MSAGKNSELARSYEFNRLKGELERWTPLFDSNNETRRIHKGAFIDIARKASNSEKLSLAEKTEFLAIYIDRFHKLFNNEKTGLFPDPKDSQFLPVDFSGFNLNGIDLSQEPLKSKISNLPELPKQLSKDEVTRLTSDLYDLDNALTQPEKISDDAFIGEKTALNLLGALGSLHNTIPLSTSSANLLAKLANTETHTLTPDEEAKELKELSNYKKPDEEHLPVAPTEEQTLEEALRVLETFMPENSPRKSTEPSPSPRLAPPASLSTPDIVRYSTQPNAEPPLPPLPLSASSSQSVVDPNAAFELAKSQLKEYYKGEHSRKDGLVDLARSIMNNREISNPYHRQELLETYVELYIEKYHSVFPLIALDFSFFNLSDISFQPEKLASKTYLGTNFQGAILDRANFCDISLKQADFTGAKLDKVNLDRADTTGATGLTHASKHRKANRSSSYGPQSVVASSHSPKAPRALSFHTPGKLDPKTGKPKEDAPKTSSSGSISTSSSSSSLSTLSQSDGHTAQEEARSGKRGGALTRFASKMFGRSNSRT